MTLEACAGLVQRGDPDRFRAAMSAPTDVRAALFPIYAFNVEVARAPWVTQEPLIAEMRLQWWRDALGEIADGGPVRRHEVVTPLSTVIDTESALILIKLVDARSWDIGNAPFSDEAAFLDYIDLTAGGLMQVAARSLGSDVPQPAEEMGRASGIANWFLAVPELMSRSKRPLISTAPDAIRSVAETGLKALSRARRDQSQVSRRSRYALLSGWRAGPILAAARKSPQSVIEGTVAGNAILDGASLAFRSLSGRM